MKKSNGNSSHEIEKDLDDMMCFSKRNNSISPFPPSSSKTEGKKREQKLEFLYHLICSYNESIRSML